MRNSILTGLLLAGWMTILPTVASAGWGGISYDDGTDAYGFSYGQDTEDAARSVATDACESINQENGTDGNCVVVAVVSSSWAALAVGEEGWGWAIADSKEEAENSAHAACSEHAEDCELVLSLNGDGGEAFDEDVEIDEE